MAVAKGSEQDVFIRRVYTHNGISVAVDIDLIKKTVSMVEKVGNNNFRPKRWEFVGRELEYMAGWHAILDAMKFATTEASKVLKEREDADHEEFVKLLLALDQNTLPKVKKC